MARKLNFIPVKENEYVLELEEQVHAYLRNSVELPKNTIIPKRSIAPSFHSNEEELEWQFEEIKRMRKGHQMMCGKMYFFYNYCFIRNLGSGVIHPDFQVCQNQWFKEIEDAQNSNEYGLVCVKRRRVGASWMEAADVLHDCIFNRYFSVGLNSKTAEDSLALYDKILFIYDNLPEWLQAKIGRRLRSKSAMGLSFFDKNNPTKGNHSEVIVVAPVVTALEGRQLKKWVCDEAGKQPNLPQMWAMTEPCLMEGFIRMGCPVIFGTSGDIGTTGAGLMHMWDNHEAYNLRRFFFAGWMGIQTDEYGNDMKEDVVRWIIYRRKKLEKVGPKAYNDFVQQYPLTVEEAFSQAGTGIADPIKVNSQKAILRANPVVKQEGIITDPLEEDQVPVFRNDRFGVLHIYEQPNPQKEYVIGCLPEGEKVLTNNGLKDIEKIDANDKLVSKDGKYVEIKDFQTYDVDEPLYEVKVANTYRTTKFTGEHPLFVSDNRKGYTSFNKRKREKLRYSHQKFDFSFKPVKDILKGEWVKYPNIYKKEVKTENKFLSDKDICWLIGLILGDGWTVGKSGGRIEICFNPKEEDTIAKACDIVDKKLNSPLRLKRKGQTIVLGFSNKEFKEFFNENFGKYSYGKKIKEEFKFISKESKLGIIAGYIDSDGCISTDKRRGHKSIEIVSVNLEMMEHLQDLLFSVGVISSVSKLRDEKTEIIAGRECNQRKTFRVRIGNHYSKKLKDIGCESIKLRNNEFIDSRDNRMGCFFSEDENYIYFQIKDINESHINGKVYNFHCETSTFLCKNISTHNCDPADHDDAISTDVSDLSLHVLSMPHGTEPAKIVAEMCYRPQKLNEYYHQAYLVAKYYNESKILVENNRFRMISYFTENRLIKYLERTPNSVNQMLSKAKNSWGIKMTDDIKTYGEELVYDYVEDYSEWIPSIPLLDEFLVYGTKNTDRVISFMLALIMLKDKLARVKKKKDKVKDYNPRIPDFHWERVNGVLRPVSRTRR